MSKIQEDKKISVVIPVLNAEAYLPTLIASLADQRPVPTYEIILVDSNSTDNTRQLAATFDLVKVVPIDDFSHGRARNLGAQTAEGEIIVLLSQDALPRDEHWLHNLLAPLADPRIAATYSRQIPRADAIFTERFFLAHRFPEDPIIRTKRQGNEPASLEDVFFSNVSSAIRRSILLQYPFDEELIMSEDQQFSRDVINAGYAVAYAPDSVVTHSHNYSLTTAFKRYFDSVYSLTTIFPAHGIGTSSAMGVAYLRKEIRFVLRNYPRKFPYYLCYNLAKIAATILAHFVPYLPKFVLRRLSQHNYHWS